jgi:hypothetical protein
VPQSQGFRDVGPGDGTQTRIALGDLGRTERMCTTCLAVEPRLESARRALPCRKRPRYLHEETRNSTACEPFSVNIASCCKISRSCARSGRCQACLDGRRGCAEHTSSIDARTGRGLGRMVAVLIVLTVVVAAYCMLVLGYAGLMLSSVKLSLAPAVSIWDPHWSEAPDEAQAAFAAEGEELQRLGFRVVAGVTLRETSMVCESHLVCLAADDVWAELSLNPGVSPSVAFWSRLGDRILCTTTLQKRVYSCVSSRGYAVKTLPPMSSSHLLEAHRQLCQRVGGASAVPDLPRFAIDRDCGVRMELVGRGYMKRRAFDLTYSLRGALVIAACALPPIAWIGKWHDRKAAQELERLLFGSRSS